MPDWRPGGRRPIAGLFGFNALLGAVRRTEPGSQDGRRDQERRTEDARYIEWKAR